MTLKKILSTFNECVFQNTAKIVNNTHKWLMLNNEKKKKNSATLSRTFSS